MKNGSTLLDAFEKLLQWAEVVRRNLEGQKPRWNLVERLANWVTRNDPTLQNFRDKLFGPLASVLIGIGFRPNYVSLFGLLFAGVAALNVSNPMVFSLLLALNMFFDGIDGVMARRLRENDDLGSLIDVTCDTLSLLIVAAGLAFSGMINWPIALLYGAIVVLYTSRSAIKSKIIVGVYRSIGSRILAFSGLVAIACYSLIISTESSDIYNTLLLSITALLWSAYILDIFLMRMRKYISFDHRT